MSLQMSDLLTKLKQWVPPQEYEVACMELSLRETKLQTLSKDNDILLKQLREAKREYDDMVHRDNNKNAELAELTAGLERLSAENESMREEMDELKKEYGEEILQDNDKKVRLAMLRFELEKVKEEKEELRKKVEAMAVMMKVLEEENGKLRGSWKEAEAASKERDDAVKEKVKLKGKYDLVIHAACMRFVDFDARVRVLEDIIAKSEASTFHCSSGEQRVGSTHVKETVQSLASDEKHEGLMVTESVSGTEGLEEKSAAYIPSQQGVSKAPIKEEQTSFGSNEAPDQVLVKCNAVCKTMPSVAEKATSSKSFTAKDSSASIPIFICDSDDEDGESKGRKRKLESTDQKFVNSQTKFRFESGSSATHQWKCEADMVDTLENNTETSMKAVCALYRQHTTKGRLKGFNITDAFRGMVLGKFLVNGGKDGKLNRSLDDLVKFDQDGVKKCRSIAIGHSSRLFQLYRNKEDPHFAPPN